MRPATLPCRAAWLSKAGSSACLALLGATLAPAPACADPLVEQETRAAAARSAYGVTGKGVAVAVLDRGIDITHPDFRQADGSTRIAWILDLSDDSGATAAGNTVGAGTIYSAAQINAALGSGGKLATRDAVGHGTATAGNCCGNGRASQGRYTGIAPEATLIVVKFTSEGAPAHDDQAAEAGFYRPALLPKVMDWAIARAAELGMPLVMLANFGSIFDAADGTDAIAREIDARFGAGKPGRAFVTGTGDDGGRNNHASATVAQGQTLQLPFQKGQTGTVYLRLWYPGSDRFTVSVSTPSGSFGPYAPPAHTTSDRQSTAVFTYQHDGGTYYANGMRLIHLALTGPVGSYTLQLTGTTVSSGAFEAYLSPGYYSLKDANRFLAYASASKTLWSGASARANIAPNSYVFRTGWTGLDGRSYSVTDEGAVGDLWQGSSVGPTWDGRFGVDLAAPGDRNVTTYGAGSYWATFRANQVSDGGGYYGMASAVSAAAPLVAGAVALMLQRNPTADAAALKQALQRSARADAFTGTVPNARWGYGKLDVQAAVAAIGLPVVPKSVSDCLFNWAEKNYASLFTPAGTASAQFDAYYYRYYPATGNYLATSSADNHIWLLGPASGGALADVGAIASYQGLAGCPTP